MDQTSCDSAALYGSLPLETDSQSIRVLDLDDIPSLSINENDDKMPLTGRLRVVSLLDSPKFATLSYVWGSYSYALQDILLCGKFQIPLNSNCADALRQLRRLYGALTIWVDAFCTNQKDNAEKCSQIGLMCKIYLGPYCIYMTRKVKSEIRYGNQEPRL